MKEALNSVGMHQRLLAVENLVVACAMVSLAVLAVSLPLGFLSKRPEFWWLVKISTGSAAVCAVALVILNIVMHG